MRTTLVIGLLLAICQSKPTYEEYEETILKLWSNTTNSSETLILMGREASRIGLSETEYYRVCTEQNFVLSKQEYYDWASESELDTHYEIFGNVNATSEVMDVLKQHNPKQYLIVTKRQALFESLRSNLDTEAEKFMCDFGESFLELTLRIGHQQYYVESWADFVKTSRKIRTNHSALSLASRHSLERAFCFSTTLRSMEQFEEKIYSQMSPIDLENPLEDWLYRDTI